MIKKTFILFLCLLMTKFMFAQASWEQYGQNRVQYRTFEWNYFDSTNFRTFYYDQGKANARYALKMAESELQHIVYMMGGRLNKKLNIIIYNSFSDYRQTNIGRKNENINDANSGKIEIIGENIPVYFDGDHNHLKQQIIKGISSVIKDNMLFGDNIKEIVKNAIKMNLSEWYTLGYVSYIANEWTPEMQAEVSNLIHQKPKADIDGIANLNATLIGHSFWRFIALQYGENQISNLLYLTRYRKSIQSSLQIVFKKPYKEISSEWKSFYETNATENLSSNDSIRTVLATIKLKKEATYSNIAVSPSGKDIAYVEKKDGQYSIKLYNVKYQKTNTIIDGGVRAMQELADPDYPLISWSPSGRKVAILYMKKNQLNIRIYTTGERKMQNKIITRSKIDRITGMCFMNDDNSVAITGIKKGASDLFKLSLSNNRIENITNDLFDDKNPVVVNNMNYSGILFLSNRTSTYIGENAKSDAFNDQFNLFLYQPSKGNNLIQLSNTETEIKFPMQWGTEEISYLTNEGNTLVRKTIKSQKRSDKYDTFDVIQNAPLHYNTLKQEYIQNSASVIELSKANNEYIIYSSDFSKREKENINFQNLGKEDTLQKEDLKLNEVLFSEYETPFDNDSSSTMLNAIFTESKKQKNNTGKRYEVYTEAVNKLKTYKYKTTFTPDFLQTTLDNTLLFTRYQVFGATNQGYQNPSLSGFLTSTLTDILEDYKLTGGARLGVNLNSKDYFFKFNNYRRRTDWELLYYHHGEQSIQEDITRIEPNFVLKNKLEFLQAKITYPFSILKSIHFYSGIRYDRKETLSLEKVSLEKPVIKQLWTINRVEFIYDNSMPALINIRKGSRYKFFAEFQQKLTDDKKSFFNIGYDARKYSTIYKNIIFAHRLVGAHSIGNAKVIYKLGGIDNDLSPKQEANTAVDFSENYAFQAKSTNLRGYQDGFLNGSSYLIFNEEFRLPIYNTFFKKNIKSGFVRNLQCILFADFGTAWKGFYPTAKNVLSQSIYGSADKGVLVYIDNSFALGYGTGIRSKILGYFIRTDFAWRVNGGKKPMLHFSLATDF